MEYYCTLRGRLKVYKIDKTRGGVDMEQWEGSYSNKENGNC